MFILPDSSEKGMLVIIALSQGLSHSNVINSIGNMRSNGDGVL
jgi:hypothetical protein